MAYSRFKMWMKDNDPASIIPNQKDFVDYLTKHFDREPVKKLWSGYALKSDDDDEEDDDFDLQGIQDDAIIGVY